MSRARLLALALLITLSGPGCWEQVSPSWFPQMKDQPARQALEDVQPLVPPAGTIPVGGIEPRVPAAFPMPIFSPQAMVLQNPVSASSHSLERGKYMYGVYCAVCHGADGMAKLDENPVAKRLAESGAQPFPLANIAAYTDGQLFTKIRYGKPLMPGYPQIGSEDRWHVVNYLRALMKGGSG